MNQSINNELTSSNSLNNNKTLNFQVNNLMNKNLFDNKKIFPLLLRFILPALLVTFFQAMYIFSDQIMMIKFIPFSNNLNPNGLTLEKLFDPVLLANYKETIAAHGLQAMTPTDLVRSAVSISAPITLILTALTLLISMGVAVSFAKALGKNDAIEIEKVWSTGFISNLIIGLVSSFFILLISPIWLSSSAHGSFPVTIDDPAIKAFNDSAQNVQINLAQGYIYVLCGFNVLQVMSQMYYFLSQSEGRQLYISIVPTFCNVLNVFLDWVLIVFTPLYLLGSAIATAIGWIINLIAYIAYNLILTKKNKTNLVLSKLRFSFFNWNLFWIIFFIGFASFLRNATSAFSNSMFQTELVSMTNSTGYANVHNVSSNIFQSYFGSVTPITNLALQTVWGVIQGGRTVASYKYGKKDYKAIKSIYWYVFLIATLYGIGIYFLFVFGINNLLLINLFDVSNNDLNYVNYLLRLTMLQSVFLAIGTTGQLYFQSTQRVAFSWFSSIIQNIILFVPLLFIFQHAGNVIATTSPTITTSESAMNFFILLLPVCTILASCINIFTSVTHMYLRMGKPKIKFHKNN